MNITAAIAKAWADLEKSGHFNGLEIIELRLEDENQKREDAKSDGLTPEATERYINDYTCCSIHLELYDPFEDDGPYTTREFDLSQLRQDFKEWLLPYLENNIAVFPKELHFDGSDMEFMKQGFSIKDDRYERNN